MKITLILLLLFSAQFFVYKLCFKIRYILININIATWLLLDDDPLVYCTMILFLQTLSKIYKYTQIIINFVCINDKEKAVRQEIRECLFLRLFAFKFIFHCF